MSIPAVEEFESQWASAAGPPNVFAFLASQTHSATREKLEVVLRDQQHRWQKNIPLSVEDYLERLPELKTDVEARLRLILSEYELRAKHAAAPGIDEFVRRFPGLAETLRSRLSTELTVMGDEDSVDQTLIEDAPPELVGRYRLGRVLGQGAFGCVYQGFDDQLERPVAVKVPRSENFEEPSDADDFLKEARLVASLDHPHVVPVYDVGRTSDGAVYIVSKFVEGLTLGALMRTKRPDPEETVRLLVPVAQALHHAHACGLIHRDVKPGNILIEGSTGKPYITDFGLAVRDADPLRVGVIAGTPSYMSPEQARGEGHRLDGRSDLFALAAVFYFMLTGQKAFAGSTSNEILHHVVSKDPVPPTSIDPTVPPELERICLKSLSKRISGRHTSAADFATELEEWRSRGETAARPIVQTIVPHGLRSFDATDAGFFAELLPGARTREGVPESVQFWIQRMTESDADSTFRVGLIYGPSGCGKSSLVKAAILPRLPADIKAIYIEATQVETELRLLRGLRKQFSKLDSRLDLVQSLQWLRQHHDGKAVIVIDQFEQWLHSSEPDPGCELIRAFGQCDGGKLQAVVMIRDDFAMAAARFMEVLDIPIVQGVNFATVDLFDERHAAKVLGRFGQAFGKLPPNVQDFSAMQTTFLKTAVGGLANGGQVVPVQLALFAEMIKTKDWEPATLKQVGGTQGVGANFLEETFSSRSANPAYKRHEQPARHVLKALLPDAGTDIKGHTRSHADLLKAAGYENREGEFNDLLRALDGGLRLITPAEADGRHSDSSSGIRAKYYQLTHDYLVPSLREWLTRKQQSTRRGRAELLMAQRAALWSTRREARQLPSMLETANILLLTRETYRTSAESQMLAAAKQRDLRRILLAAALLVVLTSIGIAIRSRLDKIAGQRHTSQLIDQLLVADIENIPTVLAMVSAEDIHWHSRLRAVADDTSRSEEDRLRAHIALAPSLATSVPAVVDAVANADSDHRSVLLSALTPQAAVATPLLWKQLLTNSEATDKTLNLAGILAALDVHSEHWPEIAEHVTSALMKSHPLTLNDHVVALTPVSEHFLQPLETRLMDSQASPSLRTRAAGVLSVLVNDDFQKLVRWILACNPESFDLLLEALRPHREAAIVELKSEILNETDTDQKIVDRHARAALALLRLGVPDAAWRILGNISAASLRTELISAFHSCGVPLKTLADALPGNTNANTRAGLLIAMGEYRLSDVSAQQAKEVITSVSSLRGDTDSAVHAAAEWLLRHWDLPEEALSQNENTVSRELTKTDHRHWWTTKEGRHVMVNLRASPSFQMGSPLSETERDPIEGPIPAGIERPFAIGQYEVTVEQFLKFKPNVPYAVNVAPSNQCPINKPNWFEAVGYCRWLSEQEGIPDDQMCYPPLNEIGPDMQTPADAITRTGYRLPTEAEWEYACRSESAARWFFGDAVDELDKYVWYAINSQERTWPVGSLRPNGYGLFDVSGNVLEWCHNLSEGGTTGLPSTIERGADVGPGEPFLRGGNYKAMQRLSRSAKRYTYPPNSRVSSLGFRIARTLPEQATITTGSPD